MVALTSVQRSALVGNVRTGTSRAGQNSALSWRFTCYREHVPTLVPSRNSGPEEGELALEQASFSNERAAQRQSRERKF